MTIELPGYSISSKLHESSKTVIFRGIRLSDSHPVIIKRMNKPFPSSLELSRFEREYEIGSRFDDPRIARCLGRERTQNLPAIIFEDIHGLSLDLIGEYQSLPLTSRISLAIRIAEAIGTIHDHRIIHKDINPSNIIWNRLTGQVNIIDFGISSELIREDPQAESPDMLEGTLTYISPEQTRRMNRSIDYRTDFYSFGVTLYELLTGMPPFRGEDALEIVHAHIAKSPVPPHEIRKELPPALSAVVEKLMAKTAEERYQGARGLITDLEHCLSEWERHGAIAAFPPGRKDFSDIFSVPQKLYGRHAEIESLMAAYNRACAGEPEAVMVTGYPGIGKSVLIHEIQKTISRDHGYFISGKNDQFKRNIPYFSLITAFSDLIRQILTESADRLDQWRGNLLEALGGSGQVMVECIPDLELVIGKQPPVQELPLAEARNRFNMVFRNFVQVLAGQEHPLVIFLDDLQWADAATLTLLHRLMTDPDIRNVFLIGAYRDNEVDAAHPLTAILSELGKSRVPVGRIMIGPLDVYTINDLVSDTLHQTSVEAFPLSEIILKKTGGNPFFINEFLKTLHREQVITFDPSSGRWKWNSDKLSRIDITDNVIDLMTRKIRTMATPVAEMLMTAACIGSRFSLQTLAMVTGGSIRRTMETLWGAVREELLLPLDDNYRDLLVKIPVDPEGNDDDLLQIPFNFRFLHDRVQQAAYQMMSAGRKQETHLRIGRILLERMSEAEREDQLFNIVNQLNTGRDLITEDSERRLLAGFNLKAGQKARNSAAYDTALTYFTIGMALLPESCWNSNYELTYALSMGCAECEYLNGFIDSAELRFREILKNVRTSLEQVRVYHVMAEIHQNSGRYRDAVAIGITALKLLGITMPLNPGRKVLLGKMLKIKMRLLGRNIDDLHYLPKTTDKQVMAIMDTLSAISSAAAIYSRETMVYMALTMLELTLEHGNSKYTPFVFASYSLVLSSGLGDYQSGDAFARLALSILADTEDKNMICRTHLPIARGVNHWVRHARTSLELYKITYKEGIETGNLVYAGWAALYLFVIPVIAGDPLDRVTREIDNYERFIRRIKYHDVMHFCLLTRRFIAALQGNTVSMTDFGGDGIDETDYVRRMEAECDLPFAILWYCTMKAQCCYLAGEYERALEMIGRSRKYLPELKGILGLPEYYFYEALALAARYHSFPAFKKVRTRMRLRAIRRQFRKWAENCKDNFLHKYLLICAESSRISGRADKAAVLYKRAIDSALDNGFTQIQSLASECAAKFHLSMGNREEGQTLMINAHFGFLKWGATAKVNQLETDYQDLVFPTRTVPYETIESNMTTRLQPDVALDWLSMVKGFQAISRKIDLSELIEIMMRITIENAGAQRGILLLKENGNLLIEAERRIDQDCVMLTRSAPLSGDADLPVSMIRYTERKAEPVIIADAAAPHLFSIDPYFQRHQKKSVLCNPILHQGKPIGILYLENDITPGTFTPERIQVLDLLSAQAAISLENARLYTQLKASESKYRSIFEHAVEGMFQINTEQRFISANPAMAKILGYETPEAMMNEGFGAVEMFLHDGAIREAFLSRIRNGEPVIGYETLGRRKDGSDFWGSVSVQSVLDGSGNVSFYEGSLVDISERKQREWAERQRKSAEEAARAKSIFLANMSHEIRTPLNAIIGLTELSLMSGPDDRQRDFMKKIKDSAGLLLRVIDDILSFSKIEAGRLELETVDFSMSEVLEKIDFMFSGMMSEKGLEMVFSVPDDLPAVLTGDPLRLSQVLINLVGNAIKFTDTGEIIIGMEMVSRNDQAVRLRFIVSDTGMGIAEENLPQLFDAFVQADGSITRRYGGTGLGLAISKNIVEMMNGRIWACPNADRGTTFYFEVDLACRDATPESFRVLPVELEGKKVLLVEDNKVSQRLMARQLSGMGLEVTSCDSGEAALTIFEKIRANHGFDMVLIDWKLPGIDGIETIHRIRAHCGHDAPPLFILVTAFGREAVEAETNAIANAILTKPVHPVKLRETLIGALLPGKGKIPGRNEAVPAEIATARSVRLLLVDDNAINREITQEILEMSGYLVDVAADGSAAVEAINHRDYNAVLMDVQMPVMDGYEATRIIRANPRHKGLVIIAMTAHAVEGYRQKCLGAGMNDYITKPVDIRQLHQKLAEHTGDAAAAPSPAPPDSDPVLQAK